MVFIGKYLDNGHVSRTDRLITTWDSAFLKFLFQPNGFDIVKDWKVDPFRHKITNLPSSQTMYWSLFTVVNAMEVTKTGLNDPVTCILVLDHNTLSANKAQEKASLIREWLNYKWDNANKTPRSPFTALSMPVFQPACFQHNSYSKDTGLGTALNLGCIYQLRADPFLQSDQWYTQDIRNGPGLTYTNKGTNDLWAALLAFIRNLTDQNEDFIQNT